MTDYKKLPNAIQKYPQHSNITSTLTAIKKTQNPGATVAVIPGRLSPTATGNTTSRPAIDTRGGCPAHLNGQRRVPPSPAASVSR